MKNYKKVDTCSLCKHIIVDKSWDGLAIYCGFDREPPKESYKEIASRAVDDESFWKLVEWEETHKVHQNGICDNFEKDI